MISNYYNCDGVWEDEGEHYSSDEEVSDDEFEETGEHEPLPYGEEESMFVVAKRIEFTHALPVPICLVDDEYVNIVEYNIQRKYEIKLEEEQKKQKEYENFIEWRKKMRRGLPTESRLRRLKRLVMEKEAEERKIQWSQNLKKAPKYATSSKTHKRKGRVLEPATKEVVAQRRRERRRVAKAARALLTCKTSTPVVTIITPAEIVIPEEIPEDEEEQAELDSIKLKEEEEIAKARTLECSMQLPIEPIVVKKEEKVQWTKVTRKRRVPPGFERSSNGKVYLSLSPKKEPCKFWAKGMCMHGDKCKFYHDKKIVQAQCKFWAKGMCIHGDKCKFYHAELSKPLVVEKVEPEVKPTVVPLSKPAWSKPKVEPAWSKPKVEPAWSKPLVVEKVEPAWSKPLVVEKVEPAWSKPLVVEKVEPAWSKPLVVEKVEQPLIVELSKPAKPGDGWATCRTAEQGKKCGYGAKCKFYHPPSHPKIPVCYHYLQGTCKFETCKFYHKKPDSPYDVQCKFGKQCHNTNCKQMHY